MKICMEVPQKLKMSNHMTQLSHSWIYSTRNASQHTVEILIRPCL
jgi:hypothetical protein